MIYRSYHQSYPLDSIQKSKTCRLTSATVDERIQIAAHKLKNAYRNNCSSENIAFFNKIDALLKEQHYDRLQVNANLHLMIEEMLPFKGEHPTLEELASSCTTDDGLLTKERYQEIFTILGKQDRWEKEYEQYLSRLSNICELSQKYS